MLKPIVLYVSLAASASASIYLWVQWRGEREINRDLHTRVEQLERLQKLTPYRTAAPAAARAAASATPARSPDRELRSDAPAMASVPLNNFRDSRQQLLK